jgi:hypothetical protein
MVTQMASLISQISALCSNASFVVSVPPKANEALFPQQAGYVYQDYVNAIVAFCNSNNYKMLRFDRSILSKTTTYFADGVHPNTVGHRIMANEVCRALGIKYNPSINTSASIYQPFLFSKQADIPYNSTWGAFTGVTSYRAVASLQGNVLTLAGIIQPNGSVSTTIGTIPVGYRPNRTTYLVGRSDAGPVALSIDGTTGAIILAAVPATWFSLEGISLTLTKL